MKTTFYFSHDYNATNDIKLQTLIMKMKYEGLGFYWHIIEMLYQAGGKIELAQCDSIAFTMHTDIEKIKELINICFEKDDKYFWSNSVISRLKLIEKKSKKAKQSIDKRWENEAKKHSDTKHTNVLRPSNGSNTIKESKVKEIKLNILKKENITKEKKELKEMDVSNGQAVAKVEPGLLAELIDKFTPLNPSVYLLYSNKTQRASMERMILKHGEERIRQLLVMLPEYSSQPYAPRITSPYQLEAKLGDLMLFMAQKKSKGGGITDARDT